MANPQNPTLLTPINLEHADPDPSQMFTWQFNDADPGDTQSAFAMRRKEAGAGTYEYWNGSTWVGTIQWNSETDEFVDIDLSDWATSTIYQWSVATKDSGGSASGFPTDRLLVSTPAPVGTALAPSGTQSTSRPTVTWTYSQTDDFIQSAYRVKIFSAAQYGAGGFDPDVSEATWDSGRIVSPTAWSQLIEEDLEDGVTYRAYVQVEESGGLSSAWSYIGFDMSLALATAPEVTRTLQPILGRSKVVVKADFNLLTDNQADLEDGDVVGWEPTYNCSISNSSDESSGGDRSLKITASGQTYDQLDGNYGLFSDEDTGLGTYDDSTASMA